MLAFLKKQRFILGLFCTLCFMQNNAWATRVPYSGAVFYGLDKITGKISTFTVLKDETFQFGSLQVTPRICYASGTNEPADTDAFIEVNEIKLDKNVKPIFSGWVFAESPGLNAIEHPVYDIWLKGCTKKA